MSLLEHIPFFGPAILAQRKHAGHVRSAGAAARPPKDGAVNGAQLGYSVPITAVRPARQYGRILGALLMGKLEDTLQEQWHMGDMPRLTLGLLRRSAAQLRETGRILVTIDLDCEAVARDLPGFVPVERFLTLEKVVRKYVLDEDVQLPRWHPNAIGLTERFEIVLEKQDRQPGDPCTVTLESATGSKLTHTVAPDQ